MRITKSLRKRKHGGFFFEPGTQIGICCEFMSNFISFGKDEVSVNITLATKNPKKKGFRRVVRKEYNRAVIGSGNPFVICFAEQLVLNDVGVKRNGSFWIKVVKH